jgi:WD40 repeat protein
VFVTEGPEDSGVVDIRDAATGESVLAFHGHDIDVNDVAFSDDGTLLATTGDDGVARIWDPTTGEELHEFRGAGDAWHPAFDADSSLFAAAWGYDNGAVVKVFDLATDAVVQEIPFPFISDVAINPGGTRIVAVAGRGPDVAVFDIASGDQILSLEGHLLGLAATAWSPDGGWIATAGLDATVHIFDAASGPERDVLTGHGAQVWHLDWSADSRRNIRTLYYAIPDAAFTPDGHHLLATGPNGSIGVWDTSSFEGDASIGGTGPTRPEAFEGPRRPDPTEVTKLAVPATGRLVAAVTFGGQVRVWDRQTGRLAFDVAAPSWPTGVAWSHDGEILATAVAGDPDAGVTLRDTSGREVAVIHEEPGEVIGSIAFGADGDTLITTRSQMDGSATSQVVMWDWQTGEIRQTIDTDALYADASASGLIATLRTERNDESQVIDIWDATTGRRVSSLVGHGGDVTDGVFSPDGSRVATAGNDGTARLWDARTGEQLLALGGHNTDLIAAVDFSPDGRWLATVGADGLVRVWALHLDELLEIAEDRLTRGFTDDEFRRYLHTDGCQ